MCTLSFKIVCLFYIPYFTKHSYNENTDLQNCLKINSLELKSLPVSTFLQKHIHCIVELLQSNIFQEDTNKLSCHICFKCSGKETCISQYLAWMTTLREQTFWKAEFFQTSLVRYSKISCVFLQRACT